MCDTDYCNSPSTTPVFDDSGLECYSCHPREITGTDFSDSCVGDKTLTKCANGTDRCASITSTSHLQVMDPQSNKTLAFTFSLSSRGCADPNFWILNPPEFDGLEKNSTNCTEFNIPQVDNTTARGFIFQHINRWFKNKVVNSYQFEMYSMG